MDYFDLGTFHREASDDPTAQLWADRGMVWLFAYNHEEAIVCFDKALAADPGAGALGNRLRHGTEL